MLYSTGEIVKLYEIYKELMFVAFNGKYEGLTIKYNPVFKTIVWHSNNVDEAVMFDDDVPKTKWKMVVPDRVKLTKHPFVRLFEECFALN